MLVLKKESVNKSIERKRKERPIFILKRNEDFSQFSDAGIKKIGRRGKFGAH